MPSALPTTPHSAGASICTQDRARAERLSAQVEAGAVFVNGMVKSDPGLPFGVVKRFDCGRELSEYGIRKFANIKSVWMATARATRQPWPSSDRYRNISFDCRAAGHATLGYGHEAHFVHRRARGSTRTSDSDADHPPPSPSLPRRHHAGVCGMCRGAASTDRRERASTDRGGQPP